jgi:hypothetical protein
MPVSNATGDKPMLTQRERTDLINEYRREPVSAAGMLLTCAAGLLMVVLLALVGIDIHTYGTASGSAQSTAQAR